MQTKLPLLVSFSVVFLLAGCDSMSSNQKLDQKTVVERIQKEADELKSISEKLTLSIENQLPGLQNKMDQDFESVYVYGQEGTITHIHTKQKNKQNGQEQTIEFYKTPKEAYLFDGQAWQKHTGDENYNSTYKPVLDSLIEAADSMQMTEEEDRYVFDFAGKDAKVYEAVQPIFQINFNQADASDLDLLVSFDVLKESMTLGHVTIEATNEPSPNQFSKIQGKMDFADVDQTKTIEIPAEVTNN